MAKRLGRILALGMVAAALVLVPASAHAATSGSIKLLTPTQPVLKGDAITLAGKFKHGGKRVFVIQQADPSGGKWSVVPGTKGKTNKRGKYTAIFTPDGTWNYRALLKKTSTLPARHSRSLVVLLTTGWRGVGVGGNHACGIRYDETLWCWGADTVGQLGDQTTSGGPNPTAVQVSDDYPVQTWRSVSGGEASFTCGIRTDGTLWCWGFNNNGQLGTATNSGTSNANSSPIQVLAAGSDQTWLSVSAGYDFTCGIRSDSTLWCWGNNHYGQLGNATGTGSDGAYPTPTKVVEGGGDQTWLGVSTGYQHTCAIRTGQTLWCWGSNEYGQMGTSTNAGTANTNTTPLQVTGGPTTTWTTVAAGTEHSCAVNSDATLWCWGWNYYGELGTPTDSGGQSAQYTPSQVLASGVNANFTDVAAGTSYHTCGLRPDMTMWCWGFDDLGQTAQDPPSTSTDPNPTPAEVKVASAAPTWTQLAAESHVTCGIQTDYSLWCWGNNYYGQLGNTTNNGYFNANPVPSEVLVP